MACMAKLCWNRYVRPKRAQMAYAPQLSLWSLTETKALLQDHDTTQWREAGLDTIGDLYSEGKICNFQELQDTFGLNARLFFIHNTLLLFCQ